MNKYFHKKIKQQIVLRVIKMQNGAAWNYLECLLVLDYYIYDADLIFTEIKKLNLIDEILQINNSSVVRKIYLNSNGELFLKYGGFRMNLFNKVLYLVVNSKKIAFTFSAKVN